MSHKPKTRFSASIDGIQRELFSIQERNDKSLIFNSGTPRYCEHVEGVLTEFLEQHYSVHRTHNGRDTSITQKTRLGDGTSLSSVTYIHRTEDYLLWPIYARRIPIMQDQTRLLKPRNQDKVIEISKFSYSTANLLYSVFVTKRGFDVAANPAGFKTVVAGFSELQLIVIPVYLNLPSINEGDVFGWSTAPMVINNTFSADHFQLETTSVPANEFWNVHWSLMELLRDKMLARLQTIVEPSRLAFVTKMSEMFTGDPLINKAVAN